MYRTFLAAIVAIGLLFAADAGAQARRFDIPPQPLATALSAYAQVVGIQLVYPPALAAGRQSPGVTGALDDRAALDRLLSGTGLTATTTDGGVVTLAPHAPPAGAPVTARMRCSCRRCMSKRKRAYRRPC